MEAIRQYAEWSATGIEIVAIVSIVGASILGTLRFAIDVFKNATGAYRRYKVHLGKMLMLALEFMVAADIIRTVFLEQSLINVGTLGLLIAVRTFLSWSLAVEIDGCWPWKRAEVLPGVEEAE